MASIIKSGSSREMPSGQSVQQVAFNFDDVAGRAHRYIEQVRKQAAQLLTEAKQQAEQIRKSAEEEGRQAAMAAVEQVLDEKVGQRMQTLTPALHAAVDEIQHARGAWLQRWQESAVRVATVIAERVVRREIEQQPEITVDLIREALELAAGSAEIVLRVSPKDMETLGSQVQQVVESLEHLAPAKVVADKEISPGGCRVETKFGSIDQQVEAQLARIFEELK